MTRTLTFTGAALLAAVLLTATNQAQPAPAKIASRVDVLLSGSVEILDIHATASGADATVLEQMYEPLVRAAKGPGAPEVPCLALKWTPNEDFTVWTFDLRKGVKFHDGSSLNAHAVHGSFQRLLDRVHRAAPQRTPYQDEFGNIAALTTEGELRVTFQLRRADLNFVSRLSIHPAFIISPTAYDALEKLTPDERSGFLNANSFGTGPFRRLKQPQHIDSATWLEVMAHEDYWGGKPSLSAVRFKTERNPEARAKAVQAGKAHIAEQPANSQWLALEKDQTVHLERVPAPSISYLAMNCVADSKQPTSNIRVRKAIAMAIDRTALLAKQDPGAYALHTLLPPAVLGHPKDYLPEIDKLERQEALKQAKALVAEALPKAATMVMLIPNIPRPYLPQPALTAEVIKAQLAEIGIEIDVQPVAMHELGSRMGTRDYALMLLGWMGVDANRPGDFWNPLLSGDGGKASENSPSGFYEQSVAEAILAADAQFSHTKRGEAYAQLERTVHDKYRPIVPLAWHEHGWAWRKSLRGVAIMPGGRMELFQVQVE